MEAEHRTPATIDEYIASFPPEIRTILESLRSTIKSAAPGASERMSYGMPTFRLGRDLVHFGAFKTHIGLFPPVRDAELARETRAYRGEKGNLRFPLDQPIPYALIAAIVKARVSEVQRQAGAKRRRPPGAR